MSHGQWLCVVAWGIVCCCTFVVYVVSCVLAGHGLFWLVRILYAGACLSVVVANSSLSVNLASSFAFMIYGVRYVDWQLKICAVLIILCYIVLWVLLCNSHYFTWKMLVPVRDVYFWCPEVWGPGTLWTIWGIDKGFPLPLYESFLCGEVFPWVWLATLPVVHLFVVWPPQLKFCHCWICFDFCHSEVFYCVGICVF